MSSFINADPGGATVNHSGKTLHGNPNPPYEVYESDPPPNGSILLAAPGCPVPADYVARYNLADKLKPAAGQQAKPLVSSSGEPLVMVGGRAVAESIAPEHLRSKPAGKPGQPATATATAQPAASAPHAGPNVIEAKPGEPGNPGSAMPPKGK